MINKRLIKMSQSSTKHVVKISVYQVLAMLANVVLIFGISNLFMNIYTGNQVNYVKIILIYGFVILVRVVLKIQIANEAVKASSSVKIMLRTKIYQKMLDLGGKYSEKFKTAEVVQVASEGIDQLEMYFSSYLPQFFYCMTAPILLFIILSTISFKASFVLFICVPLIPISIVIVQKIAKKLLAKYWGLYTGLGDDFLENIQGMTSLKIYGADEFYHNEMNKSAENFRKITMKVLTMQLNSIIIMDLVAYGGASLGAIISILELQSGNIDLFGACVIILLASEFFLPMRLLGSFFHIAMNGLSASKRMFKILDMLDEEDRNQEITDEKYDISFKNVSFSYDNDKIVLKNINFTAGTGLTSIVGVSGSGKSTISSLITTKMTNFDGEIMISDKNINKICKNDIYKNITKITDRGYIFEGTVRSNLQMANPYATDEMMINVLKKANIWEMFSSLVGLDSKINQRGSNLSGGEKQRLNIARAMLKDSPIYIFDEVTSNIDCESEDDIMKVILNIAKDKTVILISHRLQNVVKSDKILMLKNGEITEEGTHKILIDANKDYAELFNTQKSLEEVRKCEIY